ncbi:MAG: copper chaperone PCu(A)C [Pseudomonadales bacterium]|nr:copper chaperone PCu(A)C [Pseudomonadales bacterium]
MAVLVLVASCGVRAELEIVALWARASVPGAGNGAVYGELVNKGSTGVAITGVETSIAGRAGIHRTRMVDGMMSMAAVKVLDLGPGDRVVLEPGGLHIMLMGLHEPLEEGESFRIYLTTANGERFGADVSVGGIGQLERPE